MVSLKSLKVLDDITSTKPQEVFGVYDMKLDHEIGQLRDDFHENPQISGRKTNLKRVSLDPPEMMVASSLLDGGGICISSL